MYYVIDTETSIKNRGEESIGKFKASPFHPDNKIVMIGFTAEDTDTIATREFVPDAPNQCDLLVGHNIGFDLLYLYNSDRGDDWREWVRKGGKIWDTMIVEYLLTGQDEQFASLDDCSIKYGGTVKDSRIKEYWNAGIDTEDIPKGELGEYLEADVRNTEIVFLAQLQEVDKLGMLDLVYSQMEARLATIEMEYNGMYFDDDVAKEGEEVLGYTYKALVEHAVNMMETAFPSAPFDWNPLSSTHLSAWLFGGEITYDNVVQVTDEETGEPVRYKTGKKKGEIKTKRVKEVFGCVGMLDGNYYSTRGKRGWSTDENTLKSTMSKFSKADPDYEFLDTILSIRTVAKDLNTYYTGYRALVWPTDSCIHPSFNHTATATGRLSCSSPNLQQVSGK